MIDGESLLASTLARARRFAARDCVWVVCGSDHARALRAAAGLPARRVLVEPQRRNTAMAIGFAAERIRAEDPDGVLAVLPADHHIPDSRGLRAAVRRAARAARKAEVLVTLGVKPTRPDTGYGYIQRGPRVGAPFPGFHRVKRFVEKPDAARRAAICARAATCGTPASSSGRRAPSSRRSQPVLPSSTVRCRRCADPRGGRPRRPWSASIAARPRCPSTWRSWSAVIGVWTLPVDFHWSDVGTWASLAEELGVEPGQSRVIAGETVIDERWWEPDLGWRRPIALLGVEGLAVIDTGDALLVARLDQSAKVRGVVAELKAKGRKDVT